jgi:L-fuconolactonase
LPAQLQAVYAENNVAGCVAVQVNQNENENDFFLGMAATFDFIKAVIGWVDLMADDIGDRLLHWQHYKKLKGFRHILQGEKNRALMLEPAFKNGISQLGVLNFTYDILIFPDQLKFALELVQTFPNQKFVIDHLAKPNLKSGSISQWEKDIRLFKNCDNVFCKVSGMVTEADRNNFSGSTFKPCLDAVTETFGTKRLMFGSDWPVCLTAASYDVVLKIVQAYFASFSKEEQENIFSNNAYFFYNL